MSGYWRALHALWRGRPTVEEQLLLVEDRSWRVRERLARLECLSPQVQSRLSFDWDDRVLVELARNPMLWDDMQARLAGRHSTVRRSLAQNPSLAPETFEALVCLADPWDLEQLAQSAHLTPSQMGVLSRSRDRHVRAALARNPAMLWSMPELELGFVRYEHPRFFEDVAAGVEPDTLDALLPEWPGTLAGLLEACKLVHR